jgi:hypothetical protein
MSSSLKHVTKIDVKGKEFLYLSLFVIGATAFSVFIGLLLRDLLRLKRGVKKHFLDTLNVFTAFTIGWFIVLAIFISTFFGKLRNPTRFESLSNEINLSFIFHQLGMADVSDVLISPALALTLILSVYFGYYILNRWARKRGFLDIVRKQGAKLALYQSRMFVFPAFVAFLSICVPAVYLATLCNSLFAQVREFDYSIKCVGLNNNTQLYMNVSVTNNLNSRELLGPFYIGFWRSIRHGEKPFQGVRVDPASFVWASRKGLFIDPSETRYFRFLVVERLSFSEFGICGVRNDEKGNRPQDGIDYKPVKIESAEAVSLTSSE